MKGEKETWLQPEEFAYPHGGQTRRGAAIFPDGKLRRVWAGIPDTFFTIPAHGRLAGRYVCGYLTCEDNVWRFHIYKEKDSGSSSSPRT